MARDQSNTNVGRPQVHKYEKQQIQATDVLAALMNRNVLRIFSLRFSMLLTSLMHCMCLYLEFRKPEEFLYATELSLPIV